MTGKPRDNPIIVFSVRIYLMLLAAYPIKFRQEYGPHMSQVFRDSCLRAFRQNGTIGVLNLWALTLFDFLRSLIEEYLQKETFMTRSKFIRLSGWSLMLGAVTFSVSTLSALVESNFYDPHMRLNVFVFYAGCGRTGPARALWRAGWHLREKLSFDRCNCRTRHWPSWSNWRGNKSSHVGRVPALYRQYGSISMPDNLWYISLAHETAAALEWSASYSRFLVSGVVTFDHDYQC